jgi:threonine dehydrogenase-like Zn-dependent dehydrogenase
VLKASRIVRPGVIEFVDVVPAAPGPREVAVRPRSISLCGSDIFLYLHMRPEEYPLAVGTSGHEIVGVVEAVGEEVTGLSPGMEVLAFSPGQTGMTQRYLAAADCVLPLPPGRPREELLMAQQLGTVLYAVKRLPDVAGRTAAVIGQGSGGIFWAQMLRRLGCRRVIAMDLLEARVEAGLRYGADLCFNNGSRDPERAVLDATDGRGADVVVEAAGEPDAVNLAVRLVRKGGILFFFGIPHARSFTFDWDAFFRRYAATFSMAGAMLAPDKSHFSDALDLIASGAVDARGMVSHRVPFADLARAYDLARTGADGALKVVVEMPRPEGSQTDG